jgi:hypothetical protein
MARAQRGIANFREDFGGSGELPAGWQWLVGRRPNARISDGMLTLTVADDSAAAVQSIVIPSFVAETAVDTRRLINGAFAGLAILGDRANQLSLVTNGKTIQIWSQRRGERAAIAETAAEPGATIRLRVACSDGNKFRFAVQGKDGAWTELAGETDGSFLPPWDRGVRVGVYVAGANGAAASFDYFLSKPDDGKLLAK